MTPPLASLVPLLADDPAVRAVISRASTVAVPEPARALFTASLARVTTRRPVLLAVPTGPEAERLVRDLAQFLGEGEVELFPAWETLPFERVSPPLETMGRRLRVMWRSARHSPGGGGTGAGAATARPSRFDVAPFVVRPGDARRDELVAADRGRVPARVPGGGAR
jgi:transcription-repair coupling factor (superfamily II helicase)